MPTAPQFEWPQGEPLFETQWRAVTESLAGNGVLDSGDLALTPGTANREVNYAAGTVYYVASEYAETSGSVVLSAGDGTNDRWDTIAYDTAAPGVTVHEGTPAANPEPPDITGDEILLGVVYIPQNFDDVLASSQILNWQGRVSNEATEVLYQDTTGQYGVNNVAAALDELQEAAQITTYPLALADLASPFALPSITDMDAAGNDLIDGATTVWDTSETHVPRAQVDQNKITTTVTTATHTTSDAEVVLVDTSTIGGTSTITLASADTVDGNEIVVVDLTGTASSNTITVDTEGAETIDGGSSTTVDTDYGAQVFQSDGNNWVTAGGGTGAGSGGGVTNDDVLASASGTVTNGESGVVFMTGLANTETLEITQASLLLADGQAAPTNLDIVIATLDNAGGATLETVAITGDGTIKDDETGTPLASYQNTTGSAETVAVLVDNGNFNAGTGANQEVAASIVGAVA